MTTSPVKLRDNGGRRSGIDLRQFSYTGHIPERGSGEDRRQVSDRRNCGERRTGEDRRNAPSQKGMHQRGFQLIDMRSHLERRSNIDRRVTFR